MKISDLEDQVLIDAANRASSRASKIERTLQLIANGRAEIADTKSRIQEFAKRAREIISDEVAGPALTSDDVGLERKIGSTNDILSIETFEAGLIAAKSVGRINKMFGAEFGTGFLIGNGLMITNHHVFKTPEDASASEFELDLEADRVGPAKRSKLFQFNPQKFFLTSKDFDYSIVAVVDELGENPPLEKFGWHALISQTGKIRKGDATNIIQHPDGGNKSVVVHNSHFLHIEDGTAADKYCWYSGDTEEGSSGAPVFNNRWEVVALHHKAVPKTNNNGDIVDFNGRVMSEKRMTDKPEDMAWLANEGIRVSRLVQAITSAVIADPFQKGIRDDLLALWKAPGAQKRGQRAVEL